MGFFDIIKNGLNAVTGFIKKAANNTMSSFKESIYGIKITKTQTNKYDAITYLLTDNHNIEDITTKISPSGEMAHLPSIEAICFQPVIYNHRGKNVLLKPKCQHDQVGLKKSIQLAKGTKTTLNIKSRVTPNTAKIILTRNDLTDIMKDWRYDDIWADINVECTGATIDPTLFNNPYSVPFGAHSSLIIKSELLGFLKKHTDMTILTTLIIGVLLGIVLGGFMNG